MHPLLAFVLFPLLAAGCRHSSPDTRSEASQPSGVAAQTVLRAAHTALRGERALVVRDEDEWRALWQEHASMQIPAPEAPPIDFTRQMVVGVVLRTCPTGGFGVEVLRVEARDGRLRVVARRHDPPAGSVQAMVLSKPVHLVAVERSEAEVEFVWE